MSPLYDAPLRWPLCFSCHLTGTAQDGAYHQVWSRVPLSLPVNDVVVEMTYVSTRWPPIARVSVRSTFAVASSVRSELPPWLCQLAPTRSGSCTRFCSGEYD